MFLFQIVLGYVAGDLVKGRALHNEPFTLHKSLGLLVLAAWLVKWGLMAAPVIVPLLG